MKTYLVTWEIDIEADTAEEAAREALAIHRDPESIATVFMVKEYDSQHDAVKVDLTALDEANAPDGKCQTCQASLIFDGDTSTKCESCNRIETYMPI